MNKTYTIHKIIKYKGHLLIKIEDQIGQVGILIDKYQSPWLASFADAKRVINKQCPMWLPENYKWNDTTKCLEPEC